MASCQRAFLRSTKWLTQVLNAGVGGFAQHYLDAVVAGLGGGVLLATADDFAVAGDVIETVLAGLQKRLEAVRLTIRLHGLDAVFSAGFSDVAFAGVDDFAVVGAQVVPVLATALEDLEGCHLERKKFRMK